MSVTIGGIPTNQLPDLGAVTDDSTFIADHIGTGSFRGSALKAYLAIFGSVTAYGAVGDGVADDTAAINAALAAVPYVFLPPGTYKISGSLNVTKQGQNIIGAGRVATVIKSTSTTADVISVADGLNGVTIAGMTLDRSATPVAGADGISAPGFNEFHKYADLIVQHQWNGLTLGPTGYAYIENVTSWLNQGNGFVLQNTATSGALQWSFNNCLAEQNVLDGFAIVAVASGPAAIALGEFVSCSTFANSNCGFAAVGVPGCPIHGVRITGGFFGGDGNHEVFLDTYGGEHKIDGLFTELGGRVLTGPLNATPMSNAAAGFFFTANNLDVQVNACYAEGHSDSGFISSAAEALFTGCKSINNGQALAGSQAGFTITAGRASLMNVRAGNLGGNTTQLYGIQIVDATPGDLIWGADLYGNATSPLNIIAGLASLTLGGITPAGNVLLPFGGISVGTTGGAVTGGINVATHVQLLGVNYTNP